MSEINWNLDYFRAEKKWSKDKFVTRYEKAYPHIDLIKEYHKIWPEEKEQEKPKKQRKSKKKPKDKGENE